MRARTIFCWISAFFLLLAVIFLILVEVGNTKPSIDWYFIRLNLTNVIPTSVPNASLINSIARTLGLHDFYQVGLWNYCEGYNNQGVTQCSPTQTLYWFNPVAIIQSQLLAGASIQFPAELTNILDIIETASKWMFGLFLAGACFSFVLIFVVFLSDLSKWWGFVMMILLALNAVMVIAASVIATVMFEIMKNEFQNNITQVNIGAKIGTKMFAFMWVASGCTLIAFLIHMCLACCCTSKRDIKRRERKEMEQMAEKDMTMTPATAESV